MGKVQHEEYPFPLIPLSPVFSRYSLSYSRQTQKAESILSNKSVLQVTSGRAAIALALEHAGITCGDEVLLPAFHCESMVSPVKWCQATPVFYRINTDTSPDFDDIVSKISARSKVVLVTHYFGFIQELTGLRKLCDEHNLLLIEDCAHAFFGSVNGCQAGSVGDYAVASSMKFFPVFDGGILACPRLSLDTVSLSKPGMFFQIKSVFNVLERAVDYNRLGLPGSILRVFLAFKEAAWKLIKRVIGSGQTEMGAPESSGGGFDLDEKWIHTEISLFSRVLIDRSNLALIKEVRRKNYLRLDRELAQVPGLRPIFACLPPDVVPLVYPVYVEQPDRYFGKLKKKGVPIWRFGEYLDEAVDEGLCANSVEYSAHIFQFPCHQEMKTEELGWMIEQIQTTMAQ